MQQVEEAEQEYNPGSLVQDDEEGNILNFYLSDFLDAEYLSLLDSTKPHLASHTSQPSVALEFGKESGNPPVPTTALE